MISKWYLLLNTPSQPPNLLVVFQQIVGPIDAEARSSPTELEHFRLRIIDLSI